MSTKKKIAVIIGAGPAGLTSAYEFLKQNTEINPIVLEESNEIGGISRTVKYNGHRMDIGGHRFFSKDKEVMDWWTNILPIQGHPSKDDIILANEKPLIPLGPDPEIEDRTMLIRRRISRIFYLRKFFDYPISLKFQTFINMGLWRTIYAGFGYVLAQLNKRKELSLEDFIINRFGKPLYKMFFEDYTKKVWGKHPSEISADWGAQRIKGLSLRKALYNALKKIFMFNSKDISQKNTETSLIEQFLYPKYGPGQLWESVAKDVKEMGGEIRLNQKVIGLNFEGDRVSSVTVENSNGQVEEIFADYFLSSMPVKDLINSINKIEVPQDLMNIAEGLPYRDFMTVGLLVNKLKVKNKSKIKTVGNTIPDTWMYIQERDVQVGRLQVFNNWSPYLVKDLENTIWIGLEYFCNEGDEMWSKSDQDFIKFASEELEKIGIVDRLDVLDAVCVRVKKAYPAYFSTYGQFDRIREWLNKIPNLYCIGRNGQHRYNNMDHSMMTAFETVKVIKNNIPDKSSIWAVNTEEDYHETKK